MLEQQEARRTWMGKQSTGKNKYIFRPINSGIGCWIRTTISSTKVRELGHRFYAPAVVLQLRCHTQPIENYHLSSGWKFWSASLLLLTGNMPMALPDTEFDEYGKVMPPDEFGNMPVLRLDDLLPVNESLPVKLSVIIAFSSWRREQLARSLETIARQTFREFEVLICDMGSGQDMESVYEKFRPYIRLKTKTMERTAWLSCPSRGIKEMLPDASGEVIAIMQPEMLLHPDAFWYLYHGHFGVVPNDFRFSHAEGKEHTVTPESIMPPYIDRGGDTFVNLRNYFLSPSQTHELDHVDWHSNLEHIQSMAGFWTHGYCLSGLTNAEHWNREQHRKWIWWFVGSAKRTSTIWDDMPSFDGHASIDFFLIGYKQTMGYTEVIPQIALAYHQEHTRASIAPERELWIQQPGKLREYLRKLGRNV
jgi:hypothetical protein